MITVPVESLDASFASLIATIPVNSVHSADDERKVGGGSDTGHRRPSK